MIQLFFPIINIINWNLKINIVKTNRLICNSKEFSNNFIKIISFFIKKEQIKFISKKHTKTQTEVKGSNKKCLPQKGTGKSRVSAKKASGNRGGGIIFGPKKHLVSYTVNKNLYNLIINFFFFLKRKNIIIINNFNYNLIKIIDLKKHFLLLGINYNSKILKLIYKYNYLKESYIKNFNIKYWKNLYISDLLINEYIIIEI